MRSLDFVTSNSSHDVVFCQQVDVVATSRNNLVTFFGKLLQVIDVVVDVCTTSVVQNHDVPAIGCHLVENVLSDLSRVDAFGYNG
ncbi:hypothetical protein D3C86_2043810 [compost metagenome]